MDSNHTAPEQAPQGRKAITAALVTRDFDRMRCLPGIAGSQAIKLEFAIYDLLRRISRDYNGGYWDYYTLSNGGFYMAPQTDQRFRLRCDNHFEGEVCAMAAGLIACSMAYSLLSFQDGGERYAKQFYLLGDFIAQRGDAGVIHAALD